MSLRHLLRNLSQLGASVWSQAFLRPFCCGNDSSERSGRFKNPQIGMQSLASETETDTCFHGVPGRCQEVLRTIFRTDDTLSHYQAFAPPLRGGCLFLHCSKLLCLSQLLSVGQGYCLPHPHPSSLFFQNFPGYSYILFKISTLRSACQVMNKNSVDILNQFNDIKFVD